MVRPAPTRSKTTPRDPMPRWINPMKATLAAHLPAHEQGWAFEIKWDGVRALFFHHGRQFQLFSRNNIESTFRYPEIAELGRALGHRTAILDGEIIALDEHSNPSFPLLAKRMHVVEPDALRRMEKEVPVFYMIFDVLYLDGHDLRDLPYLVRRQKLESLTDMLPPACRLSLIRLGELRHRHGEEMRDIARQKGLEGLIAKRTDSPYETGRRSPAWLKIKLVQRQELVIGGWVPQVSAGGQIRSNDIGAIILGYYDRKGAFHNAGAVGTGFNAATSAQLVKTLKPLKAPTRPFAEHVVVRRTRAPIQWVRPEIVVEVEYRRWPKGGLMNQAAFKGIRTDKPARDVVREVPADN